MLGVAGHAVGWPFPGRRNGSRTLSRRAAHHSAARSSSAGGSRPWPTCRRPAVLLDLSPRQVVALAGDRLTGRYRNRLARYRYGPGAFKVDYALDGPIPWRAAECRRAATVHVGGTLDEIAAAEQAVWDGGHPERPFVLVTQPSLFDPTRAPPGRHTAWGYCHVPNGSAVDMTSSIERQVERFAPGFCDPSAPGT